MVFLMQSLDALSRETLTRLTILLDNYTILRSLIPFSIEWKGTPGKMISKISHFHEQSCYIYF